MDNVKAFPLAKQGYWQEGMTLRDYFAAKAMQGTVSSNKNLKDMLDVVGVDSELLPYIAEKSYQIADAMLKARQSTNKTD